MDRLTLELAKAIYETAKPTDGPIFVRIHPSYGDGAQNHWLRGSLVGISGKNLLITPIHGQRLVKHIPPPGVKLWESRMSQSMKKLIANCQIEINKPVQVVSATIADDSDTRVVLQEFTLPVQQPMPDMETQFSSKLDQFKKLKNELANKAQTEGLERLKRLYSDLRDAREMLAQVESEIIATCKELGDFKVAIPEELRLEMQEQAPIKETGKPKSSMEQLIAKVKNPAIEVVGQSDQSKEMDTDNKELGDKSHWCKNKAKHYKNQIITYFQRHGNYYISGPDLMRHVGETVTSASNVLMPLVEEGVLVRFGVRNNIRYKLKT